MLLWTVVVDPCMLEPNSTRNARQQYANSTRLLACCRSSVLAFGLETTVDPCSPQHSEADPGWLCVHIHDSISVPAARLPSRGGRQRYGM
jgi:hypothetical protein